MGAVNSVVNQNSMIMNTSEWIAVSGIASTLFVSIIGSTALLSYKMGTIVERLESAILRTNDRIDSIDKRVTRLELIVEDIQKTLTQIQITIAQMQMKLEVMWQHHLSKSNSPKVLNEAGLKALEASKIGSFVNDQYEQILFEVRNLEPKNAYQAQETLINVVNRFKHEGYCIDMLQEAAFASGYDIDSLLFVAALSIRDRVISDLGFVKD